MCKRLRSPGIYFWALKRLQIRALLSKYSAVATYFAGFQSTQRCLGNLQYIQVHLSKFYNYSDEHQINYRSPIVLCILPEVLTCSAGFKELWYSAVGHNTLMDQVVIQQAVKVLPQDAITLPGVKLLSFLSLRLPCKQSKYSALVKMNS